MTTVNPRVTQMMVELGAAWEAICEKHFTEDEAGKNELQYYAPFSVQVSDRYEVVARFMEEGIDFYPKDGK